MLRAAILDWAGTTVDFGSRAPVLAFVEVFRRRGIRVTECDARKPMGANKREHVRRLLEVPGISRQWLERTGSPWNEECVDELYREFIPIQVEILRENSALVPGTVEAIREVRARGLKVGTTTGYNREMLAVVAEQARRQGYDPDCNVSSDEVPAGRPAPWMALTAAMRLGAYPMSACVKVGDTVADIEEGRNAGMWTVAVTRSGNELGLSEAEAGAMAPGKLRRRLAAASERLLMAGADYVIPEISELRTALDEIERRLARGERP